MIVLFIVACGFAFYFYSQWQKAMEIVRAQSGGEITEIIEVISQLMDLPEDETPTLATVSDKEKLKDQQFFAKAENGDKVLMYNTSLKAILYRPSTKRVIEVAPIYVDENEGAVTEVNNEALGSSEQQTIAFKLALYNGSGVPEKHTPLVEKIQGEYKKAEIVIVKDTTSTYAGSVVVDINGSMNDEANKIATLIGGIVAPLPATEQKPDADILIIIGK